jgi:hypothetical protein
MILSRREGQGATYIWVIGARQVAQPPTGTSLRISPGGGPSTSPAPPKTRSWRCHPCQPGTAGANRSPPSSAAGRLQGRHAGALSPPARTGSSPSDATHGTTRRRPSCRAIDVLAMRGAQIQEITASSPHTSSAGSTCPPSSLNREPTRRGDADRLWSASLRIWKRSPPISKPITSLPIAPEWSICAGALQPSRAPCRGTYSAAAGCLAERRPTGGDTAGRLGLAQMADWGSSPRPPHPPSWGGGLRGRRRES